MGKKINKGVLSYLFILLGIGIAFFLVCAVIMICSPGTSVLGFMYFENKNEFSYENATTETGTINFNSTEFKLEKIVVETNNYDVQIIKMNDSYEVEKNFMKVNTLSATTGFAKVSDTVSQPQIEMLYTAQTKTLSIKATGSKGFINFTNSSKITIFLPAGDSTCPYDILINSQQGDVLLGVDNGINKRSQAVLKVKSLNIETTSGNVTSNEFFALEGLTEDSSIKTVSGEIMLSSEIKIKNFFCKTDTNNITVEKQLTAFETATFETNKKFITLNTLISPKIKFIVESGKVYAGNLIGEVDIKETADNCDFEIGTIKGSVLLGSYNSETISTRSNLTILQKIDGNATITTAGKIKINEVSGTNCIIRSTNNVTINSVKCPLKITSTSGQIILGKPEKVDDVANYGINSHIDISSSKNSNIDLYFANILTGSSIKTESGSINALFAKSSDVKILAKGKSISVEGETMLDSENKNITETEVMLGDGSVQILLKSQKSYVNIFSK